MQKGQGNHSFCSQKYAVTCFRAVSWQLGCVSVLLCLESSFISQEERERDREREDEGRGGEVGGEGSRERGGKKI